MLRGSVKHIGSLFVAVAALLLPVSNEAAVNASVDESGNLRGSRDLRIDIPFLQKVKENNNLEDDFAIVLQECTGSTLQVDSETISIARKDLAVVNGIFTEGAEFFLNGHKQYSLPFHSVYKSLEDPTVIIVKGSKGRLQSATKIDPVTGETISVVPIEAGSEVFITVHENDIDQLKMNQFKYGDGDLFPPGEQRSLQTTNKTDRRALMSTCESYQVIELAVAYDHTFCQFHGSAVDANAAVQSIVSQASMKFEQICMRVMVSHVDGYCNEDTDPFVEVINGASQVCGNDFDTLLFRFRTYWRSTGKHQTISADTVHLFHGVNFPENTVGCAWNQAICGSYAYGVNQVTYTTVQSKWSTLIAHEIGHNVGAGHSSSSSSIMFPTICNSCLTFDGTSANAILSHISTKTCLETVIDSPSTSGAVPSSSPSGSPSISPSLFPSSSPSELTASPVTVTESPTESPSSLPTLFPSPEPSQEPSPKQIFEPAEEKCAAAYWHRCHHTPCCSGLKCYFGIICA
ncbi:ADAM metallopeptidase domain 8 [Seminavis robusta]|uniref:ADAM metallopeptidase domain 8 n=1 Tax=Seminavis robusta TaxID=568900 RepID=A0A9N8DBC9_9STRA|nr:ADAM metallopeptidase domain 8 [Seminavis robusta]|eukprot:Sro44_g026500.1 ADAM metallopeptidase domain 8 (517) ;mRNA; f:24619-26242